jgi:hypothetical protein
MRYSGPGYSEGELDPFWDPGLLSMLCLLDHAAIEHHRLPVSQLLRVDRM